MASWQVTLRFREAKPTTPIPCPLPLFPDR